MSLGLKTVGSGSVVVGAVIAGAVVVAISSLDGTVAPVESLGEAFVDDDSLEPPHPASNSPTAASTVAVERVTLLPSVL